jgi:hypothetical protein
MYDVLPIPNRGKHMTRLMTRMIEQSAPKLDDQEMTIRMPRQ